MGNRRGSDRITPGDLTRWWTYREAEDGTQIELREWLDVRYEEGWRVLLLEELPTFSGGMQTEWFVVVRGSHARHDDRPLTPAELEWLLRTWPAELRTLGPGAGLLARS